MYRPSCLFEANVRPEKYWLVCVGLLANNLLILNFFLSDGLTVVVDLAAGPVDVFRRCTVNLPI
jgi:hypothetical protein